MQIPRAPRPLWIAWFVPVLALAWVAPRFLPGGSPLDPETIAAIRGVDIRASLDRGRFELIGVPQDPDAPGVLATPGGVAALGRLRSRLAAENDDLGRFATGIAGRIERFPHEDVTGLRLSGEIVPFYDYDAERLTRARTEAASRPYAALETVRDVVEIRMSEPDDGFVLEESTRRRDLTRLARDIRAEIEDTQLRCSRETERFRRQATASARASEGPFRRRGNGRILEIMLAALLAAALRIAMRPARDELSPWLSLVIAPVLAMAAVLLAEGTRLLPVDPVAGTAPRFIAFAFALGIAAPSLLDRLAQAGLERPTHRKVVRRRIRRIRPPEAEDDAPSPDPGEVPEARPARSPKAAPPTEREIPEVFEIPTAPLPTPAAPPVSAPPETPRPTPVAATAGRESRRSVPARPVPQGMPFARKRRRRS